MVVCYSVGPAIGWQPVQSVPCLSPDASWDRLQRPLDRQWDDAGMENGRQQ